MPSVKRQARAQREGAGRILTLKQETTLLSGFGFGGGRDFATPEEMESAWFIHRDRLLSDAPPFCRPFGYWRYEANYIPQADETEQDCLLRLKLDLTAKEKAILRSEAPGYIPESITPDAAAAWDQVLSSIIIREQYHTREGRLEQATLWREHAGRLIATMADAQPGQHDRRR
jgi:hypothetical protein